MAMSTPLKIFPVVSEFPNAIDSFSSSRTPSDESSFQVDSEAQSAGVGAFTARRLDSLPRVEEAVRILLECIGEDVNREGLLKTPARVAKSLLALTAGYEKTFQGVVGDALFESSSTDMVLVRDIECFSLCEHHMLPFFGRVHVAYLPSGKVLGLSKLARIVEVFSKRLQIQERLTEQVAKAVEDACGAKGVAVTVNCQHMCMTMRGVEKSGASTISSCYLGAFREDKDLRGEFLRRTS